MTVSNRELNEQATALARIFHRPHSTIRFANNGSFELCDKYWWNKL